MDFGNGDGFFEFNDDFGFGGMIYENPDAILKKIDEERKLHFDSRSKQVGDRVVIWDFTACSDDRGNRILTPILVDVECIVIETGVEDSVRILPFGDFFINRDLVVFCPSTGTCYLTASNYVKRLDRNKK